MRDGIAGHWVAAATPLTETGAIDHAAFARHADWLFGYGVDGLVLFGTTGEGTSFTAQERLDAVAALMKHGVAADKLAIGAGYPAIGDSVALCRDALSLGLRHALVLPPYFFRDADAAGLEAAFAAIIDGVADDRLRMTLYHIPQVSGVAVPPAVLANLRRRYGAVLAGLKDSSADFAQFEAFRAAAPDVALTLGNEADIARALAIGGAGTICGMSNIVPDLVAAMFTTPGADVAMKQALALMSQPFLPVLKATIAEQKGEPGWTRARPPIGANGKSIAPGLQALRQRQAA